MKAESNFFDPAKTQKEIIYRPNFLTSVKRKNPFTYGLKNRNYPVLNEAFKLRRTKRIKKRKVQVVNSFPRLYLNLINISERIQQETKQQNFSRLRRTGNSKSGSIRKLSSLKKSILTLQALWTKKPQQITKEFLSGLPKKLDLEKAVSLVKAPQSLHTRLRKAFNSSILVRVSHASDIRVREYVENVLSSGLESAVMSLLNKLNYLQLLKKKKEPGRAKKRLVFGLNEVRKKIDYLYKENWPRLVVIAVDVVENDIIGATNEQINSIIMICREKEIPICFAGTRKELGLALYGRKNQSLPKVSVVAIINYMGEEVEMLNLMKHLEKAREEYTKGFAEFIQNKCG